MIGQAWTIEALSCAALILDEPRYAKIGEEVFFQHKFNPEIGLWNRLEIDGNILSIDDTFNHQLWFAACASLLKTPRQDEIRKMLIRFMECLHENISVLDSGLIYHPIERELNVDEVGVSLSRSNLKNAIKSFFSFLKEPEANGKGNAEFRTKMISKSIGYHQFNMYAFAMLKNAIPKHGFWLSEEFNKSIGFLMSKEYKNGIHDNQYGYPYNPPGYEVPYALNVLTNMTQDEIFDEASWWVNEQFTRCYSPMSKMMNRNTSDPLTHTARIYECTRFPISLLERIEIEMERIL